MMRPGKVLMPVLVLASVLMMVIPISPVLLDVMLAANLTVAVLVLLGTMLLKDSLEFSVFPSLLLVTTLMRLALNVSSTRQILLNGYAGKVIDSFGSFVVGGSVLVGLVVFFIIVIIQFVVITSGASRVAEVGARFTLDAMPGRQMAIDADLSSGLIDETQARDLRARIAKEADFYGAMDGASKFVKGDAIAGLVVTVINLFGGFAIGMGQKGMSLNEALETYSLLSVGDGLVSQLPALLISLATGLLVTRVRSENDLGNELSAQIFGRAKALRTTALMIAGFALLPGLPKMVFFGIAALLWIGAGRADRASAAEAAAAAEDTVTVQADSSQLVYEAMRVEPLELHLAYDTLDLIDSERGGDLLARVKSLRDQIAAELGVVMPYVRTRDDVSLAPGTYRISLRGVEAGRGSVPPGKVLAIPSGPEQELRALGGTETTEPVFGLTAFWLPAATKAAAASKGATVVDRSSVVVTHLAEVVRSNAASLLTRQRVQELVEILREEEPVLANDVGGERLPLGTLHVVLRRLLDERVPVKDLARVIEALTARPEPRSVDQLVVAARIALGPSIVYRISPLGVLSVVTLDPTYEAKLVESLREVDGEMMIVPEPGALDGLISDTGRALADQSSDQPLAVVASAVLRRPLRKSLAGAGLDVPVLAYPELPPNVDVQPVGVIGETRVNN
ncbi:MAG: flagellar biosynthesis protein FlhA [Acidimicrobiia bacterium]